MKPTVAEERWIAEFERRFINQYPTAEMIDFIRDLITKSFNAGYRMGIFDFMAASENHYWDVYEEQKDSIMAHIRGIAGHVEAP